MARPHRSAPAVALDRSVVAPTRTGALRGSAAKREARRGANTAEVIILSAVAALTLILGVRLFG